MGFVKNEADSNLYFLLVGDDPLILVLYAVDLFLIGSGKLIARCKRDLAKEFKMKGCNVHFSNFYLNDQFFTFFPISTFD